MTYNPDGSGSVHIDKAISGTKRTGGTIPLKSTAKVTKKSPKKKTKK
jgi:hypothetical protein